MTDKVYNLIDPNTGNYIPVDMVDNGDGTYSPKINATTSGGAGLTNTELRASDVKVSLDNETVITSPVNRTPGQIPVTLTLDTSQYAIGDVLAATQEVPNFFRTAGGSAIITDMQVLDEDKQSLGFDVILFKSNVDIGTENAAYGITDIEMRERIGRIAVTAADYEAWTEFSTAYIGHGATGLKVDCIQAASGQTSLWLGAISKGAGTYTASGIKLLFGYMAD